MRPGIQRQWCQSLGLGSPQTLNSHEKKWRCWGEHPGLPPVSLQRPHWPYPGHQLAGHLGTEPCGAGSVTQRSAIKGRGAIRKQRGQETAQISRCQGHGEEPQGGWAGQLHVEKRPSQAGPCRQTGECQAGGNDGQCSAADRSVSAQSTWRKSRPLRAPGAPSPQR